MMMDFPRMADQSHTGGMNCPMMQVNPAVGWSGHH